MTPAPVQGAAAPPKTDEIDQRRHARGHTGTTEDAERRNEVDNAKTLESVEEAIRALIGRTHDSGKPAVSLARADVPKPPPTPSTRVQVDARPLERPIAQRSNQAVDRSAVPRRLRLEPEIVPEPPAATRQNGLLRQATRLSLVIVFVAAVAYGVMVISALQPAGPKSAVGRIAESGSQPSETVAISEPPSRLVVEDQQTFANEPLSLTVRVEHGAENELLLLEGLAPGTTLSAGAPKSPSSWQLPYDKLAGLYLYAPKDFVGVMNAAVDLLSPDKRLLDSRTMQLKWIARQPTPAPKTLSPEATAGDHLPVEHSLVPAIEPIEAGHATILMQRGRDFLDSGDVSAARVAFRRLADAANADAALALARTYDPDYLAAHNFFGVSGDRATARELYQRARELGSAEASRILARMQ